VFGAEEYISKIIQMKKEGLAKSVTSLVSFDSMDNMDTAIIEEAASVGITVYSFKHLIQ